MKRESARQRRRQTRALRRQAHWVLSQAGVPKKKDGNRLGLRKRRELSKQMFNPALLAVAEPGVPAGAGG